MRIRAFVLARQAGKLRTALQVAFGFRDEPKLAAQRVPDSITYL